MAIDRTQGPRQALSGIGARSPVYLMVGQMRAGVLPAQAWTMRLRLGTTGSDCRLVVRALPANRVHQLDGKGLDHPSYVPRRLAREGLRLVRATLAEQNGSTR